MTPPPPSTSLRAGAMRAPPRAARREEGLCQSTFRSLGIVSSLGARHWSGALPAKMCVHSIGTCSERHYVGDGEGTAEALDREWRDVAELGEIADGAGDPRRHEDLAVRRGVAEARGRVDDRADRAVVEAAFEADLPQRRKALRDSDAEADLMAAPTPPRRKRRHRLPHRHRQPDGAFGRVGTGQ